MAKITVVGAGNVGSQTALCASLKKLGKIILIDILKDMPKGKALDMRHANAIINSDIHVKGTNDYKDTKDSDVVIITAGMPRKPGMSRDDLVKSNAKIIKAIVPKIVKESPNSILIILTNPLDAMVHLAHKLSKFPKNRVMGMAGVLDTARFKTLLSDELNVDYNDIESHVLGSHGDLMVPVINQCKVKGQPLKELLETEKIEEIIKKVKNGGAEIVSLLKTGSAFFAPGIAAVEMAEAIINDKKTILPCTVLLEGEYSNKGVFMGVPTRLGKNGIEQIIEIPLSEKEQEEFNKSADHIRKLVKKT